MSAPASAAPASATPASAAPAAPAVPAAIIASREIAARSLRSNYRRVRVRGRPRTLIVCGPNAYEHVHARDFGYTTGGALLLGDHGPVRDTLETLLEGQREDGLLPRGLASLPPYIVVALDYLGLAHPFRAPIRANYVSEQMVWNADTNALLVWAAQRYVAASGDRDFARRHRGRIERAMAWYGPLLRRGEGLVLQPHHSDWQDSVARSGRVFYTNVCFWKGLLALADLARALGAEAEAERHLAEAGAFRERARRFFWDESQACFRNSDRIGGLEPGAVIMAAAWGFSEGEEIARALASMERAGAWRGSGYCATVPDYPLHLKSLFATLSGNGDYHDSQVWSWSTALAASYHARRGERARALEILRPIAEIALREGEIGEVYDRDRQVKRWLARSESPFSWGAGMWLEALAEAGV
jgi:glycogen debranching enzyme